MTLESIYYIGQTIAVALLIISIVFVGLQIRQNTKATRASSAYAVSKDWSDYQLQMIALNIPAAVNQKIYDPDADLNDFDAEEALLMHTGLRAVFFQFEAQFSMYSEGCLAAENWNTRREWLRNLIRLPVGAAIFDAEVKIGTFIPSFVEEMRKDGVKRDVVLGDPSKWAG